MIKLKKEYFLIHNEEQRPNEECEYSDFCQQEEKITKPNSRKNKPNNDNLDGKIDIITRGCKSRKFFLYKIFAKKNLSNFKFKKPNHKDIFERVFLNEADKKEKKKLDKWYKEFIKNNNKYEVFKKLEHEKITGYLFLVFTLIKKLYSDDNDVKEFIEEYFKNEKIDKETFLIPEFNKTFEIDLSIDSQAETYYFKIKANLTESNFKDKFPEIKYDTRKDKNGGNLNDKFYRILEFIPDHIFKNETYKLNENTISGLASNESTSASDFKQSDELTDENNCSNQCLTDFQIDLDESKVKNEKSKKSRFYKHVTTKLNHKDVEMGNFTENEISISENSYVEKSLINSNFNEYRYNLLKNSLKKNSDSSNLNFSSKFEKFSYYDNNRLVLNEVFTENQISWDENLEKIEQEQKSLLELEKYINYSSYDLDMNLF